MNTTAFEGWAILELMGHRVRAGFVKEVEIAGGKLLRIDIPVQQDDVGQDVRVTEFYGAGAVYALRPCAEEIVRDQLSRYDGDWRPVRPLEYRDRPPAKPIVESDDCEDDDGDDRPF